MSEKESLWQSVDAVNARDFVILNEILNPEFYGYAAQGNEPTAPEATIAVAEALARLDRPPRGAVFIGDSPFDCRAGRAAGVSTAVALWGPFARAALEAHQPDHWLERPEQILALSEHWLTELRK